MNTTIKAIETRYKGYRFRSRLEARWAVFFDALSIKWEYEKEGYDLGAAGWYLPDFWLPESNTWVEIKGSTLSAVDEQKMLSFRVSLDSPGVLQAVLLGGNVAKQVYENLLSFISKRSPNQEAYALEFVNVMQWIRESPKVVILEGPVDNLRTSVALLDIDKSVRIAEVMDFAALVIDWLTPQPTMDDIKNGKYNYPNFYKALDAARAARFEHGERGL